MEEGAGEMRLRADQKDSMHEEGSLIHQCGFEYGVSWVDFRI